MIRKRLKEFWLWIPGVYRILIFFTPVVFVVMTKIYLDDSRDWISAVLNGFGFAVFYPVGIIALWFMHSILGFIIRIIFGLPFMLIRLIGIYFGRKKDNENKIESYSEANIRKFDQESE